MDQEAITTTATITPISRALAFGNGTCLLFSHQLRLLGVNLGASAAPATAPAITTLAVEPLDPASIAASQQDYFAPPGLVEVVPDEEEDDAGSVPAPTAAAGSG